MVAHDIDVAVQFKIRAADLGLTFSLRVACYEKAGVTVLDSYGDGVVIGVRIIGS